MVTEAQKKARAKYQREKTRVKTIQFYQTDMELLEHAEKQGAFSTYVKRLIREDMEGGR